MPISCESNDLIAAATCFQCNIPPGMQGAVQTYLLDRIRVALGGAEMTVEELLDAAKCYETCIPAGFQGAADLYLLCEIANT